MEERKKEPRRLFLRGRDPVVEYSRDSNLNKEVVRRMEVLQGRQKCGGGYRILRKKFSV